MPDERSRAHSFHRNRHAGDRARNNFLVERPQILDRSAAAADDHDLHTRHARHLAQRPFFVAGRYTTADIALYRAKSEGRNRIVISSSAALTTTPGPYRAGTNASRPDRSTSARTPVRASEHGPSR